MNAVLILNPRAGSLVSTLAEAPTPMKLHDAFAAVGVDVSLSEVNGRDVAATVRAALAEKPDAIFVGGGDGTLSAAAGVLAGTGLPLGVVPLGTLNHFARDLGLPPSWREAVPVLARARSRRVDVGEVNGRVFLNNCSLGSYAEAVRRRDTLRRHRGHGKWLAMAIATFQVFRELRRVRIELQLPDQVWRSRTPFMVVANNRYTGHVLDPSLRPRLDEGRLWFYSTRARDRADLLRMVWQTLLRRIDAADALELHSAAEATVTCLSGHLPVAADGELIPVEPPLQFRIRREALLVLTPPTPTAE